MTQPKPTKTPAPQTPSSVVADRIKEVRARRGWSAADLAERCTALGMPELNRSVIANIESQRRRGVTVDELFVFAVALDVAPVHLLVPVEVPDDQHFAVAPAIHLSAHQARSWIRGDEDTPDFVDRKAFLDEVPRDEWEERWTRRKELHEALVGQLLPDAGKDA
jgi:transcriptional regulator with XRE-family HTH domain